MYLKLARVSRGLLLVTLMGSHVYLMYGKEDTSAVHIVRNPARNELITQIKFLPADSRQDSLEKESLIIQKFLKEHETEVKVGFYEIEVSKLTDQVRSCLRKADKNLETLSNELSRKEEQATLGR